MSPLTENETREFRSPQRKLVRFFERSRDKWKREMHGRQNDAASCSTNPRNAAVERSRVHWRIRRRPPDSVCRNSSRYSPNKKEPDRPARTRPRPALVRSNPRLGCCSEGTSVLRGDHWNLCRADSRRAPGLPRGASGAIEHIFRRLFGRDISTPCANTGRL